MNTHLLMFVGVLLLGTAANTADAAPRSRELQATPIYRRAFYSNASGTKTFATTNLRTNASLGCGIPDTIIVVTRPDGTEVMNDNCNSTTKASCVNASGSAGSWLVTVFASKETVPVNAPPASGFAMSAAAVAPPQASQTHCGITDVTVSNVILDRDVTFGGALVEPGLSGMFTAHAVSVANGADDPVLLAYSGSWQELGYDNDSGAGRGAAQTRTLTSTSRLVVGSFSAAASGRAALVINDCTVSPDDANATQCRTSGKDRDGDSLSNLLEGELGTDPDHHDTDRDGLFDYYEVLGRQLTSGGEQELRRYGANPRRRDLFVELDREVNTLGDIGILATLEVVDDRFEDSFLDLPQLPLAPDGSRLIAAHFDTGEPCPTRPTLCGDWGGSQLLATTFTSAQDQGYPDFARIRRGLFQYAYRTTGGAGQSYGTALYARTDSAVVHELGHNLGLGHWGGPDKPRLNVKPNYPSLMQYVFQGAMPGVAPEGRSRFSEGRLPPMDGPISETTWDDGSAVGHLTIDEWKYEVVNGAIDLNRDLRRGGDVIADLAPLDRGSTGHDPWPHMAGASDLAPAGVLGCVADAVGVCRPSGGPAIASLAVDDGAPVVAVFAPYLHTSGLTYPDLLDYAGSGSQPLPPIDGDANGEPASAMYEHPVVGAKTLLIFPRRGGGLSYQLIDMSQPLDGAWRVLPGLPPGSRVRNVNVVRVGDEILAVWRDRSRVGFANNVLSARFDVVSETWSEVREESLRSDLTPGITLASDGDLYIATLESSGIRVWRRAPSAAGWVSAGPSVVASTLPVTLAEEARARLSLEFVPLRNALDEAFADGSGQLQLWWPSFEDDMSHKAGWKLNRAQLIGYFAPDDHDITGQWAVRRDGTGDRPHPGHSIDTAMVGLDMSAVYSAVSWDATGGLPEGGLRATRYLPYASGLMPGYVGLLDNDDAAVIATGMCHALWFLVDGSVGATCRCETGVRCTGSGGPVAEEELCEPE